MHRALFLLTFWFVIGPAGVGVIGDTIEVRTSETIAQSGYERCFQDTELSQNIAKLKLQSPACRVEIVQELIRALGQATDPAGISMRTTSYGNMVRAGLLTLRQQKPSIYLSRILTLPTGGQPQ
ncbi:MAG TPA: hypothetical protein VGQ41_21980 [Pyrinomonadaceae bacterium]|jgi:hypothetical protein|nr:hypothetical protein [Pyrinomonadaceae bacterium]